MNESLQAWRQVWPGVVLALLTILYGYGLGAVFGANEDGVKGHLAAEAEAVLAERYGGDLDAAKAVVDKSWRYIIRAHLHAGGLGTSALATIALLAFLPAARWLKMLTATGLGAGALGYALYWLLAGLRAPSMGSTGAAKESLEWLAIPASSLCILGLLMVLGVFIRAILRKSN